MRVKRDYYKVLGVSRDASQRDIQKAFRCLALRHHPDLHPGDAKAEAAFKCVSEANEVLSRLDRRSAYDRSLPRRPAGEQRPASSGTARTPPRRRATEHRPTSSGMHKAPPRPHKVPGGRPIARFCKETGWADRPVSVNGKRYFVDGLGEITFEEVMDDLLLGCFDWVDEDWQREFIGRIKTFFGLKRFEHFYAEGPNGLLKWRSEKAREEFRQLYSIRRKGPNMPFPPKRFRFPMGIWATIVDVVDSG